MAYVSLIVDLGIQPRDPFVDKKTLEEVEQEPCHQIAILADIPEQTVDYGGQIGEQPYRLSLNDSFKGVLKGFNFYAVPPRDADGKIISGRPDEFHPTNGITKLATATGRKDVITSLDVSALLGQWFMAEIEVKEQTDKNGKKDKDGNPLVYKYVRYKGGSSIPRAMRALITAPVHTPLLVTFDSVTEETVKWLRADLRRTIKQAINYAGSNMEACIKAFEARHGLSDGTQAAAAGAAKPPALPAAPKPATAPTGGGVADMDDDIPF